MTGLKWSHPDCHHPELPAVRATDSCIRLSSNKLAWKCLETVAGCGLLPINPHWTPSSDTQDHTQLLSSDSVSCAPGGSNEKVGWSERWLQDHQQAIPRHGMDVANRLSASCMADTPRRYSLQQCTLHPPPYKDCHEACKLRGQCAPQNWKGKEGMLKAILAASTADGTQQNVQATQKYYESYQESAMTTSTNTGNAFLMGMPHEEAHDPLTRSLEGTADLGVGVEGKVGGDAGVHHKTGSVTC